MEVKTLAPPLPGHVLLSDNTLVYRWNSWSIYIFMAFPLLFTQTRSQTVTDINTLDLLLIHAQTIHVIKSLAPRRSQTANEPET